MAQKLKYLRERSLITGGEGLEDIKDPGVWKYFGLVGTEYQFFLKLNLASASAEDVILLTREDFCLKGSFEIMQNLL